MHEMTYALLETETSGFPVDAVGWAVLVVSLLITVVWLLYLYR